MTISQKLDLSQALYSLNKVLNNLSNEDIKEYIKDEEAGLNSLNEDLIVHLLGDISLTKNTESNLNLLKRMYREI